ncbi:MAG: hypothetical protein IJ427_14325 [Lachnospiraceae bacterium]|nr:hypothetical protein [Lachnospiraceae bacterium]MBQ8549669.1 hypothetical protein [Lachnospiraceae bacterium]
MKKEQKATVVYLEDGMLISKKEYSCWKEIQDEYYEKYITSFKPWSCEEIISFFEDDLGAEENWPFSRKRIIEFFRSDEILIRAE